MPSDYYRVYVYQISRWSSSLLEHGETDRQTDATERPIHAGGYTAGMDIAHRRNYL